MQKPSMLWAVIDGEGAIARDPMIASVRKEKWGFRLVFAKEAIRENYAVAVTPSAGGQFSGLAESDRHGCNVKVWGASHVPCTVIIVGSHAGDDAGIPAGE